MSNRVLNNRLCCWKPKELWKKDLIYEVKLFFLSLLKIQEEDEIMNEASTLDLQK